MKNYLECGQIHQSSVTLQLLFHLIVKCSFVLSYKCVWSRENAVSLHTVATDWLIQSKKSLKGSGDTSLRRAHTVQRVRPCDQDLTPHMVPGALHGWWHCDLLSLSLLYFFSLSLSQRMKYSTFGLGRPLSDLIPTKGPRIILYHCKTKKRENMFLKT